MNKNNDDMLWVEKYRPNNFDNIVLDEWNSKILNNIINDSYFPNLLFYGPPGTGKTTTIINMIQKYQKKNNHTGIDLVIHLNASDERGIDTIRNQLYSFVNTKNLFSNGCKFVVLDEVDYMTKKAQQSLIKLIDKYPKIHFCLICNYITKIEKSLRDSFMNFKFNQLPVNKIISFLSKIVENENINISNENLHIIQKYFKSDMRSMINYIQLNSDNCHNLISNNDYISIIETNNSLHDFTNKIYEISIRCNIDRKNILKNLCKFYYKEYDKNVIDILTIFFHNKIDIDIFTGLIFSYINKQN
jgi:replication factor C subunit 3/5